MFSWRSVEKKVKKILRWFYLALEQQVPDWTIKKQRQQCRAMKMAFAIVFSYPQNTVAAAAAVVFYGGKVRCFF